MPAAERKISTPQMRALWASARDLGYDSDDLHHLVRQITGSDSIAALSARQAKLVLDRLIPKQSRRRPLGKRRSMATPKQIGMIDGLWRELGEGRWYTPKNRKAALRGFLRKRFGVSDIRFLTVAKARNVIEALKRLAEEQDK